MSLAKHFRLSPEVLSEAEMRSYLLHLRDGRVDFLKSLTKPPQAMMKVRNLVIESRAYDMDLGVIATLFDGSEFEIILGDLKQFSSTN